MDKAEADVLAYMGFTAQHRAKIHSTNLIEQPTLLSMPLLHHDLGHDQCVFDELLQFLNER